MNNWDENYAVLLGVADPHVARLYDQGLTSRGHQVRIVTTASEARATLGSDHYDVIIVETDLGGRRGGLELAHEVLREQARPEVIVLAGFPSVANAVAIAKAGAFDYLSAPVSVEQVESVVAEAGRLARTRRAARRDMGQPDTLMNEFLSSSVPAMLDLSAMVRMVAGHPDACALVVGENGSGKDIVARLIQNQSQQPRSPFVIVNLLDSDPALLEERLFGAQDPAMATDPSSPALGAFAQARGGTLVLRGIDDMPPELQPRLLAVLESRVFRPLGGRIDVPFRARVVATTDRDVSWLADSRNFLQPLFFRLASVMVRVPSLRERIQDMPRLARAILEQISADASRPGLRLSASAIDSLSRHTWPGNLRELRNVLTRLALLSDSITLEAPMLASILQAESLTNLDGSPRRPSSRRPKTSTIPAPRISGIIAAALDGESRAERERIEEALASAEGHRERAAANLGMSRTTLWTRMRLLGIDADRFHKRRDRVGNG